MFQEWLDKNNIKTDKEIFLYTAWWNNQAKEKHKKNLHLIKPFHIRVFENTIKKEITNAIQNSEFDRLSKIFPDKLQLKSIRKNINEIASHLLTNEDIQRGFFDAREEETVNIDYSLHDLDLLQIDGMSFGEYTIYLPKTSTEVLRGGLLMCNCMGSSGGHKIRQFLANSRSFQDSGEYLDAHILKNNKLVGIFALEEILTIKKRQFPVSALFVNYCNSRNISLELELQKLILKIYGVRANSYINKWDMKNSKEVCESIGYNADFMKDPFKWIDNYHWIDLLKKD